MIISMFLLWTIAVCEFLLILGLAKKNEKANEEIKMMVRKINTFLDTYTTKNQNAHAKTTSVLEKIADKLIELENNN